MVALVLLGEIVYSKRLHGAKMKGQAARYFSSSRVRRRQGITPGAPKDHAGPLSAHQARASSGRRRPPARAGEAMSIEVPRVLLPPPVGQWIEIHSRRARGISNAVNTSRVK
jgi:hypothetical protein